jgi:hypothetical protein
VGNWGALRERRVGVMLHYDGSASDTGALSWLRDHPDCRVSYNWLVMDDGRTERIAPDDARAWHAGACTPSDPSRIRYKDANSAFYGVAFAAKPGDIIHTPQYEGAMGLVRGYFDMHRWLHSEWWRLSDHHAETRLPGGKHRKADLGNGLTYSGAPLSLAAMRAALVTSTVAVRL